MSGQAATGGFDGLYAATYDLVYQAKDYAAEVDAVFRLLDRYQGGKIETLLDLGCGTGRHATLLAQRGCRVTGIDRSDMMLSRARQRAAESNLGDRLDFTRADLRSFDLARTCDAAVMMFNVLGYIVDNDGLLATLRAVRRHLDDGHLFIFDFWYGPAVVADPPRDRVKEFPLGGDVVKRTTTTNFRPHDQRCDIDIRLQRVANGEVDAETTEHHEVRYFFPLELDLALRASGFELTALHRFPQIDEAPNTDDWSVVAVAVAAKIPGAAKATA